MNDYARLKWADDPRWSNARKRNAQKLMAGIGEVAAEARAECQRSAVGATARRLADVKRKVAALHQAADRSPLGPMLTDVPEADGRAAYERMDSPDAVERSLRSKVAWYTQRLAGCRARVAEKTTRLARLHTRIAHDRHTKTAAAPKPHTGGPGSMAATEKIVDALKLCNRRMACTISVVADNEAMYKKLNEQLVAEVRQQAALVVELLSYGSTAQQESVEYNRRHCQAEADHKTAVDHKAALSRYLRTKTSALETNRNKNISSYLKKDFVEKIDFHIIEPVTSVNDFNESMSYSKRSSISMDEQIPFTDWVENGLMKNHMYREKESAALDGNDSVETDTESITSFKYTYPVDKVNLLAFGNREYTRSMEAAEYVCETLDFDDMEDVMRYFTTVKDVETRIRNMVSRRKHQCGVARKDLESAADLKSDSLNCVPVSTLLLDDEMERVQRDGLEVQRKRLRDVNVEISEYGALFNELWFQLDNLANKLDRCQVPPVRKYQKHMKNPPKCSETMADAESMLEGLCVTTTSGGVDGIGDGNGEGTSKRTLADAGPVAVSYRQPETTSGWKSAVDACRKLVVKVHTKVKPCMAYVGGRSFDENDDRQLTARAYFTFKQQCQVQDALLRKRTQNRPQLNNVEVASKDRFAGAAPAGILTREQTKQQAEDIVQWFLTPKDPGNAMRSRKPISFRKARIAH